MLTPTQNNFKHKYLHATCGISTEEGIKLRVRCLIAELSANAQYV